MGRTRKRASSAAAQSPAGKQRKQPAPHGKRRAGHQQPVPDDATAQALAHEAKRRRTEAERAKLPVSRITGPDGKTPLPVSINDDDAFFADRLELVSIEHYLPQVEDEVWLSAKFLKNPKNKAQPGSKKGATDELSKNEKRRKRFGQDAEEAKTNAELVAEHAEMVKETLPQLQPATPARNYEELKQRLADKIKSLRESRAVEGEEPEAAAKRKRDRKADAKNSKKDKQAKRQARAALAGESTAHTKDADGAAASASPDDPEDHERMLRERVAESILHGNASVDTRKAKAGKRVKGEASKISFGQLAGLDNSDDEDDLKNILNKPKIGKNNIINVKRMLKQAEENKALINELKQSSRPEDRKAAALAEWDKIEKKALGERVIEPAQLKKKIKRIEREKAKSAEQWEKRKAAVETSKKERIDKRFANIKEARDKKVSHKLARKGIMLDKGTDEGATPGRKRAGFEGRHSGFLNKDDRSSSSTKGKPTSAKKGKSAAAAAAASD